MAISKRLRSEVMRRDTYTCRYCGVADAEVREQMGDDFTDYDLVANRLRHLCIWVNLKFAHAKVGA